MSNETSAGMTAPARPKVGDVVWFKAEVSRLAHDGTNDVFIRWPYGRSGWMMADNITHIGAHPPAQERKPWETLREAAGLIQDELTERQLLAMADYMERAAAPPDPVELLREYVNGPVIGHDWQDRARAAIAAHDAKQKDR